MKRIVLFFFSFTWLLFSAYAQEAVDSLEYWAATYQKAGKSFPQEEVFVHLDNTCYFLGDTLYYKAYVMRSDTRKPTNVSKVLYVELLNQDGYLVERQILRMQEGQAHGAFCLADTLYAGYYELRAYTRWQLNWGRVEHPHNVETEKWFLDKDLAKEFYQDYEKLYSRVFPIYDKPGEAGEYAHDMTLRPLRRQYGNDETKPRAVVRFFPEGGAWVEGLSQQLAFEADTPEGEHLDGTLTVYNRSNEVVVKVRTEHRGRGSVLLACKADEPLTAEFTWAEGKERQKVSLPVPVRSGAVMHVEEGGNGLDIMVQTKGLDAGSLGLCISVKGVLQHYQAVTPGTFHVDTDEMPSGVAQLTLYDRSGKVLSDRMVFLRNRDLQPAAIRITGIPKDSKPFEKVSLGVKAPGQGTISLAVRDQAFSDYTYDDPTILTELLLSSQVKGFVEQPGYYFESNDEAHRRHLDLLLLVQGWRRYRWEDMTQKFHMYQPFEQHRVVSGEVYRYDPLDQEDVLNPRSMATVEREWKPEILDREKATRGSAGPKLLEAFWISQDDISTDSTQNEVEQRGTDAADSYYVGRYKFLHNMRIAAAGDMRYNLIYNSLSQDLAREQSIRPVNGRVLLHAEYTQPHQRGVEGDAVVDNGRFSMDVPDFDGFCYFFLSAAKERKQGVKDWIVADADEYPEYYVRVSNFYPRFVKPYSYYQAKLAPSPLQQEEETSRPYFSIERTDLREVSVTAKYRGLRSFNVNKPAVTLDVQEAFNQLSDAGLCPAWYSGSIAFSVQLTRMLVGDMGINRTYDLERRWNDRQYINESVQTMAKYNHLENLDEVQLFTDYAPRLEGDADFEGSNQPKVTINLCRYENDAVRSTWRDRRYVLPGYNVCEDFYHPDYSRKPLGEVRDYRRTLYWNPDLKLDENGCAEIQFYNNGRQSRMVVSAEGVLEDGTLVSDR